MPTNPLEALHESYVNSQNESGMGTLSGLAGMLKGAEKPLKADAGTSRLPLSFLPPGTKAGDRISLTVTGVDGINGTVTVVADSPDNAVPEAPEANKDIIDTSLTMGPMDDLKSYLFQKSRTQEE